MILVCSRRALRARPPIGTREANLAVAVIVHSHLVQHSLIVMGTKGTLIGPNRVLVRPTFAGQTCSNRWTDRKPDVTNAVGF